MTHEERAKALVARWEHGDEKHRAWLRDTATPDVLTAFASVAAEAERLGYARGWQAYAETARPKPMLDKQA